jgi:hypothetical protein
VSGGDALYLPKHNHVHQLLPVQTQLMLLILVRAPEQRRANATLSQGI